MNNDFIVEEITRLVMEELSRMSGLPRTPVSTPGGTNILVILDEENDDVGELFQSLSKVSGGAPHYHVYAPEHLAGQVKASAGFLPFTPVENLKRHQYRKYVVGFDRVVVPYLTVNTLAKIAGLIGDEPASGLCIHALMAGKPVTVCTDEIHALNYSSVGTGNKLMGMIRDHIKTIEEMGIETVQLKSLTEKFSPAQGQTVQQSSTPSVKAVVTNDDVMVAVNQKQHALYFPVGSIITPLAWETAEAYGIEIHIV